ncbi:MAG: DUF3617 domain-containing protein [Burkholderiales bacterium]|nr:DUF3617 domain-containing protein [Burkholderiales bacterium]
MKHIALGIMLAASTMALADAIKVKPGLWETTLTRQVVDGQDMTRQIEAMTKQMAAASLQSMTPEQRKQFKGAMDNKRACVSPAMAADYVAWVEHNGMCKVTTKPSLMGSTVHYALSCNQQGRVTTGTGDVTFSGDNATTHMEMVSNDAASGKHTVQVDMTSRYLGADCQGIQPYDQQPSHVSSAN